MGNRAAALLIHLRELPESLVAADVERVPCDAGSSQDSFPEIELAHDLAFLSGEIDDLTESLLVEEIEMFVLAGHGGPREGALHTHTPEALPGFAVRRGENTRAVNEVEPVSRDERARGGGFLGFLVPDRGRFASLWHWASERSVRGRE